MFLTVRKTMGALVFCGLCAAPAFAADAATGKDVYGMKCKSCHGAEGQGNPAIAKMFKVEMKPLSSAEVQGMSDAQLKDIITKGKGKMHAQNVSGSDLDNLVAYLRTLKK